MTTKYFTGEQLSKFDEIQEEADLVNILREEKIIRAALTVSLRNHELSYVVPIAFELAEEMTKPEKQAVLHEFCNAILNGTHFELNPEI